MTRLYKCDDWAVTTRTCLGNWEKASITLDKSKKLIHLTVPSFSGFVVGESLLSTVQAFGTALYYYTGQRVNGNITAIPLENPENKYTVPVTNGLWGMSFDMLAGDVEHLVFVVEDDQKKGYNYMKLPTPSAAKLNCTVQNISLSGYSLDVSGSSITSGNVRISVLDTDYTNITTFSGGTWGINFHPCLVPGEVYTLQILISDNTGRRGETLQKYPAK